MFHLSKAKDAQNQDFADISGENQRLSASENRVAMENRNERLQWHRIVWEIDWKELSEVHYDYTFQKCMNSYIYVKVTACNNIFVVTAYSLKVFLRKFMGQRVKTYSSAGQPDDCWYGSLLILMSSLIAWALIIQEEIQCWSLLGLKGL